MKIFEATRKLGKDVLSDGGIAVFHAPRREVRESEFGDELVATSRDYGTSTIWFLEHVGTS